MLNIAELINLKLPLILASKSPRRKLLLERLGFEFEVLASSIKEKKFEINEQPEEYAKLLSYYKANDVANLINKPSIVLGADTIVVLDDELLHKPKNKKDAFNILLKLSGRTHSVFTGITIIDAGTKKFISDYQKTEVTFRQIDEKEIRAYIETGSPMDKAGAYGIQDDFGAVFVSHINGCYYNIVGLPLTCLYLNLKRIINEL